MESRSSVPADDELPPLDSNHVNLTPLIAAVIKRDYTLLEAWREQGYLFLWQDHKTRKTLLEELGALGEFASINALGLYELSQNRALPLLDDAARGAASANYPLQSVTQLQCFKGSWRYAGLKAALYGAARGGHKPLLAELLSLATRKVIASYADQIVLGAAEAGDEELAREYIRSFSHENENILYSFLHGAVIGGHANLVEKILNDHQQGILRISDDNYKPYYIAIVSAAERGDVGLTAKIFALHTAAHVGTGHSIRALIIGGLIVAARCGHEALVMDLISRAQLLGMNFQHEDEIPLRLALAASVHAQRYKMAKLLLMHGAKKSMAFPSLLPEPEFVESVLKMFRIFADPLLCYQLVSAYVLNEPSANEPLLLQCLRDAFNDFNGLSDTELHTYFKNKELVSWLLLVREVQQSYRVPKDILILIGTYLTLPDKTNPVTHRIDHRGVGAILSAIEHKKSLPLKKRERVIPLPDPVVIELKQKMTQTLQAYLRGKLLYHQREALDLVTVIEKLWSIESIYMLLKDQKALLDGEPDKHAEVHDDIFHRLAATPKYTGHSIFHKISLQADYLQTLEACLQHIYDARHVPAIKKLLDDKDCYQPASRNRW